MAVGGERGGSCPIWCESIWPKCESVSQQSTPSMLHSKCKGKETSIQWKSFRNWPWKFYPPCILGEMGRECSAFHNTLVKKIAEKRQLHQSIVTNWIRTKISFALLKSTVICLRGSRSIRIRSHETQSELKPVWDFTLVWGNFIIIVHMTST